MQKAIRKARAVAHAGGFEHVRIQILHRQIHAIAAQLFPQRRAENRQRRRGADEHRFVSADTEKAIEKQAQLKRDQVEQLARKRRFGKFRVPQPPDGNAAARFTPRRFLRHAGIVRIAGDDGRPPPVTGEIFGDCAKNLPRRGGLGRVLLVDNRNFRMRWILLSLFLRRRLRHKAAPPRAHRAPSARRLLKR